MQRQFPTLFHTGVAALVLWLAACSATPAGNGSSSSSSGASGGNTAVLGATCSQDSQCGAGHRCDLGQTNGMCVKPCLGLGDCDTGSACLPDDQGNNVCRPSCTADVQCRYQEGYHCESTAGGTHTCRSSCLVQGCVAGSSSQGGTSTVAGTSSNTTSMAGATSSTSTSSSSSSSSGGVASTSFGGTSSSSSSGGVTSSMGTTSTSQPGSPWTCPAWQQGDGVCDCGCGVADPDCGGAGCNFPGCVAAACAFCHQDDRHDSRCGAALVEPTQGWTCSSAAQNNSTCDCGCGISDSTCGTTIADYGCSTPGCTGPGCGTCHDATGAVIPCERRPLMPTAMESRSWTLETPPNTVTGNAFDVLPDGTVVVAGGTSLSRRSPAGAWTTWTHGQPCPDTMVFHDSRGRLFLTCASFSSSGGARQPTLWEVQGNALLPERAGIPLTGTSSARWSITRDAAGNTYVLQPEHADPGCTGAMLYTRPVAADAVDNPVEREALWTSTCLAGYLAPYGNSYDEIPPDGVYVRALGREIWHYSGLGCPNYFCGPPSFSSLVKGVDVGGVSADLDTRYEDQRVGDDANGFSAVLDNAGTLHVAWFMDPAPDYQHRWRVGYAAYDRRTQLWQSVQLLDSPDTETTRVAGISLALHPVTQQPQVVYGVAANSFCDVVHVWRKTGSGWVRSSSPAPACDTWGTSMRVDANGRTHIMVGSYTKQYLHD